MKIIAHRGLSAYYPENTLLAFQKAIEAKADGIETDLRLTRDKKIILFHDENLRRITGEDLVPETLTLEEIKALTTHSGEPIATLDELLELAQAKLTLILEIKYNPTTYIELCERTEQKIRNKQYWIEISCFEDKVLKYMHVLNPNIKLHKLIQDSQILRIKDFDFLYNYVEYFDIDIHLRKKVLKLDLFKRHKVIFWTVDKEDLSSEIEAGLYGIMTNDIKRYNRP